MLSIKSEVHRITRLALFVFLIVLSEVGIADNATELGAHRKSLDVIANFANEFCARPPLVGSGSKNELSGAGKAKLNSLLKRIADLGIEGSAKYQASEYQGLLQEDLVAALNDSTNCRLRIWQDLNGKLIAANCFNKQLTLDMHEPVIHLMTGYIHTVAGRYSPAVDELQAALSSAQRSKVFTNLGDVEVAIQMLQSGNRDIAALQKQLDSAVRAFDNAVRQYQCNNFS